MKKTAALLSLCLIVSVVSSQAQTSLYWDANGATAGLGGTGNWTSTGANWATNNSSGTASVGSGAWTSGNGKIAVFAGTAGTVSLSSGTVTGGKVQVDTTGYTLMNSSTGTTSANRYIRATNGGFFLGNNVNLNISSGITTNGAITGFQGPFTNSVGTTGASLTVTGTTLNADSSVRIGFDGSETDIWVPLTIATTGSGYASLKNVGGTNSIYANVTVNSGSRLTFGASSSSRRINVRGNLTTDTDLTIGDGSGDLGMVVLYGNNSIGGNVLLKFGQLGYGTNNTAFGSATIVISDGTSFGQQGSIGTTDADRTIANKISLQGNATFGLGSFSSFISGNVDLNNAVRTVTLGNSTYLNGAVTNGGIILASSSSTRTLYLNGANTITKLSWTNGAIQLGAGTKSIGTLTMSGAPGTNSIPTLFMDYGVTSGISTGGAIVLTGTNNKITVTNSTSSAPLPVGNYDLLSGTSVDITGLNSGGMVLSGSTVANTNVVLNGPTVLMPDRTTYKFLSTGSSLQLQVGVSAALDLTWTGGDGNWDTTATTWDSAGTAYAFSSGDNAVISGGTLTIAGAGIAAGVVTISGGSNTTLTGGNLAAVSLIKSGTGTLNLNSTGNFTQGLIVDEGTLNIGSTTQTTTGLSATNGSILGTGNITATSAASTPAADVTNTIGVSLAGSFNFTKNGAGTTTLSGSNIYVGDTVVAVGVLQTAGDERIPDGSLIRISNNATLRLGGNETVRALEAGTTSTAAILDLQTNHLTFGVGSTSNSFGAGSIQGTGKVTKVGSGIQSWDSEHTFSGGLTLKDGSIRLLGSGTRSTNQETGVVTILKSAFGSGTLTVEGGRVYSSSLTNGASPGRTIYTSVNINGDFALGLSNSLGQTGDLTVSTNVTGTTTALLKNSTITFDAVTEWQQPLTGAGLTLIKAGPRQASFRGSMVLDTFTVSAGRADLRASNDLTVVNVAAGATLGYGTTNRAFGLAPINLAQGSIFGQVASMGTTTEDRTIPNNLNVQGDVTFGLGGYGNYFSGKMDLGGANRTIVLGNSTHLLGVVTNGGIVVDNDAGGAGNRTLNLLVENSHEGGTSLKVNATLGLGHPRALGTGSLTLLGNSAVSNSVALAFTNRVEIGAHTLAFVNTLDLAVEGEVTGTSGGGIIKTNSGALTLRGPLNYPGNTTVQEGSLVVEKSSLTATLTATGISVVLSNAPAAGIYDVLPGPLTGTYPSSVVSVAGLPPQLTASFNTATGDLEIASVPAPANLSYGSTELSATNGVLMTTVTPTCDNSPTSYAIDPALPGGLNFSTADGSIGGTPNVALPRSLYTVTAINAGGNTQRTFYLTVAKANPSITAAPVASAITAGQALSSSTLNGGTASVAGTFAWTDSYIIPPVGTSSQSVTFTPSDTANYNTATASVNVTVISAGPTFDDAYPGKALSEVAPNGLSYLVNYAFGGNSTNGPQLPVQITSDPSKLTLQAFVRTNDSTLTVVGEVGASLTNWDTNNPLAGTATADQSGAPAGTERREFTVNTSGSRMFLRLKATK